MISAQMAITGDGSDHRRKGALGKPGGAAARPRPRDDRWVQRSPMVIAPEPCPTMPELLDGGVPVAQLYHVTWLTPPPPLSFLLP